MGVPSILAIRLPGEPRRLDHRLLAPWRTADRQRRLRDRSEQPVAADPLGPRCRHRPARAPDARREGPGAQALGLTVGGCPVDPVAARPRPPGGRHQPLMGPRPPAESAGARGQYPSARRRARAEVHLPLPAPQCVAPRLPRPARQACRPAERPRADGRVERRQPCAPTPRPHHPHGQQNPVPHGAPWPRVREPTAGHHTVPRRRPPQRLPPGMAGGDEARTGPHIRRLAQACGPRLVPRGPHQGRHRAHMGQPQPSPLLGPGEDDVVMRTRQPPGLLVAQPAFALEPRTWRTPPVANAWSHTRSPCPSGQAWLGPPNTAVRPTSHAHAAFRTDAGSGWHRSNAA